MTPSQKTARHNPQGSSQEGKPLPYEINSV